MTSKKAYLVAHAWISLFKNNFFLLTDSVLPKSLVLTVSGISFPHGTIRNVRVPVILACKELQLVVSRKFKATVPTNFYEHLQPLFVFT